MFPDGFQTARLLLRPIRADDAQAIFDGYAQDPEVTRYLSWHPHRAIEETRAYVRMCVEAVSSRTYAIVLQATGAVIGGFDLRRTAPHKLEFGYVLSRQHWGRGLMTDALVRVADEALRQPSTRRIGTAVDVDNAASICVLEKAGFGREGLLRRWLVHPNVHEIPRDCFIYSRVQ